MKKYTTILKNVLFRAFVGGMMYGGFEIAFDNSSSRSMILVGAIAFIVGGEFSIKFKKMSMAKKSFWIANIITALELISGLLWNQNYQIWDYRNLVLFDKIPLHFMGHICIPFWLIWFVISPFIIWLTDKLKDEEIDLFKYYKRLFRKGGI